MSVFLLCLFVAVCVSLDQQESGEVNFKGLTEERKQQEEIVSNIGGFRMKRQAFKNETDPRKWTQLKLEYKFDETFSKRGRSAFRKAANLWMRNTCINITEQFNDNDNDGDSYEEDEKEYYDSEQTNDNGDDNQGEDEEDYNWDGQDGSLYPHGYLNFDKDLIMVSRGNNCASSVGRRSELDGLQAITLTRKCEKIGYAAHELGHALGFWHTHVRHDRDEYITVNETNIDSHANEFEKKSSESNDNYGLPYDYGSVMHYGTTACFFGDSDLGFCNQDNHEKCKNQGFAHPRNCSKCICPSGYGGDFCDERPTMCGAELNVTTNWTQLITADFSQLEAGSEDGYKRCVYWLKAPNGSNIEVRLRKLPENVTAEGCIFAGVEIKARQDQGLTGYRFCSKDDVNTTLISNSSTVPVISYMRRRRNDTSIELEYRIAGENNTEEIEKTQI